MPILSERRRESHGLCWVHAERLVHELDSFTEEHRAAQDAVRNLQEDRDEGQQCRPRRPLRHLRAEVGRLAEKESSSIGRLRCCSTTTNSEE
jgi:hypothetical protein